MALTRTDGDGHSVLPSPDPDGDLGKQPVSRCPIWDWIGADRGHLIVGLAAEFAASLALPDTAPLLEEERDAGRFAVLLD